MPTWTGIRRDWDRGGNDVVEPEAPGHHDVLPDVETELAATDLFDEQPGRDRACVVSGEVCGAVFGGRQTETRFVPARVTDNQFNNPEYRKVLER